ncbi:MAG: hypothetical protein R6V53_05175 [Candidatus Woesearchaeota archaeon]
MRVNSIESELLVGVGLFSHLSKYRIANEIAETEGINDIAAAPSNCYFPGHKIPGGSVKVSLTYDPAICAGKAYLDMEALIGDVSKANIVTDSNILEPLNMQRIDTDYRINAITALAEPDYPTELENFCKVYQPVSNGSSYMLPYETGVIHVDRPMVVCEKSFESLEDVKEEDIKRLSWHLRDYTKKFSFLFTEEDEKGLMRINGEYFL